MNHDWWYSDGPGWGVVGPRATALLPVESVEAAQWAWPVLDAGGDLDAVVTGLRAVGSVVVSQPVPGGVRVVVGGTGVAVLTGHDGVRTTVVAGPGGARHEQFVPGVAEVQCGLGTGPLPGGPAPEDLPVRAGVVRTGRLTGTVSDRAEVPVPAPVSPSVSPFVPPFVPPSVAWPPPAAPDGWAPTPAVDPGLTLLPPEEPEVPAAPVGAPAELPPDVDPVYLQIVSGHTVFRTVEGAALRGAPPEDTPIAPPVVAPPVVALPVAEPSPPTAPEPVRQPVPASFERSHEVASPPPEHRPAEPVAAPSAPVGLISSVPPGLGGPAAVPPPAVPTPTAAPEPAPAFQPPTFQPFPAPAPATGAPASPAPASQAPAYPVTVAPVPAAHPDDEAGLTIARVARDMGAVDAQGVPLAGRKGWLSSLVCPVGHANPPVEVSCRVCGQSLAGAVPQLTERPVIGRLTFDGPPGVVVVTRSLVVGRKPTVDRVAGDDVPDLVPVPTNDGGVSRSHVRVGVDGWHVTVEDLHATNGTVVVEPDGTQRRLRPGEERLLVPGCRVVLGDTVSFRFGTRP